MKWEYKVVAMNHLNAKLQDLLNLCGEDGWEFVCTQHQPPMTNLIFKREAKSDE